ncbi:protein of unknown function [Candidatus Nitrosotalea okcheonensis]|uniref:Uncharacterized protein n=1 Tax=Candidatus Nitrosotalea okcheonensis TaxID=1903276 RepID=A0A2H1FH53_9ARCH|nr:protein of unknown function [Candidatus Nitrosotalea okcheonensis]
MMSIKSKLYKLRGGTNKNKRR